MSAVGAADNTLLSSVLGRAQQFHEMAMMNVMDVSRKVELAVASPLGNFGIGGMFDMYA